MRLAGALLVALFAIAAEVHAQRCFGNEACRQSREWQRENAPPPLAAAAAPAFSVAPGKVAAGTQVTLQSKTPDATIYFTTGNWWPTTKSIVYTGPILIDAATQVSAFSSAPGMASSPIVTADYKVTTAGSENYVSTDGVLKAGTMLRLVFVSSANSKKSKVGDVLKLTLDEDVNVGGTVVLRKGAEVEATITGVNRPGMLCSAGEIDVAVQPIRTPALTVPLSGGGALAGTSHGKTCGALFFTIVGTLPAILMHGGQAAITPGMQLTASVTVDTPLQP